MAPNARPPLPVPTRVPLDAPADFGERLMAIRAPLPAADVARLGDYLGRLLAMNEHMNLTSIRDPQAAWERHILDALTLVPWLADFPAGSRVLDVGSGGGVPGIPLAIARPDLRVTLLEATAKKTAFLSTVSAEMGLTNVTVCTGRAEQLARGALKGVFSAVTARAVAPLITLAPLVLPFLQPGCPALLIKGGRAELELLEAAAAIQAARAFHEQTLETPTGKVVVLRRIAEKATAPEGR